MSEEEYRSQISAKQDEITRIEEEATKNEASAEKGIEDEYNPKISAANSTLTEEEKLRDEAIEKAAEWTSMKKEKTAAAKIASKELSKLKSDKGKALNTKLKEIQSDKKNKIKLINGEIKALNKQIKAILKEQARAAQ
ncbi:hypothetical protein LCGC14_0606080 [marine sediment metagenome]|uniref:Uncharacterized protein n=1 Tax=marine sediment metagenome TaxID=412755 RepID=A0A0F9TV91_9ZZZZ